MVDPVDSIEYQTTQIMVVGFPNMATLMSKRRNNGLMIKIEQQKSDLFQRKQLLCTLKNGTVNIFIILC